MAKLGVSRTSVREAAEMILEITGHRAVIETRPDMPVGPMNRVADNSFAKKLLGWEPQIKFVDGLHQTIDWYFKSRDRSAIGADLERRLTER